MSSKRQVSKCNSPFSLAPLPKPTLYLGAISCLPYYAPLVKHAETIDALCFQVYNPDQGVRGELRHGQFKSPQFTCCK